MPAKQILARIESSRVIAILRGALGAHVEQVVAALVDGGITGVEFPLNAPGALASIRLVRARFETRLAIGAGTVLSVEQAQAVAGAGGQFIVSPNVNQQVIQAARSLSLASFPGAFSPTEIMAAIQRGADAVKVFPASGLGPGFLSAIRKPLGEIRLVPTGGATPEIAREYRAAGAWAVGVGSELIGEGDFSVSHLAGIRARAHEFVEAMTA